MKAFIKIFALFILVSIVSCDYITEPFQDNNGGGPIDSTVVMRNIFIEDFTGHKCNNCPDAAEQIEVIKGLPGYEGRVVSIAVHTGNFADPKAPPFTTDYTTTEGDALESFFVPGGYPTGLINRIDYPTNHFKSEGSWPDVASTFIDEEASLNIEVSSVYNEGTRKTNISVETQVLKDVVGDYNVVLVLTEDSIVSAQRMPDGSDKLDYVHSHVLRTTSNTIWGEPHITGSAAPGDTLTYSSSINVDNTWRESKCHIVAFVYETTSQEVIQVEEIKLK